MFADPPPGRDADRAGGAARRPLSPAPDRIAALDGLRGIAVMGILLMNIISFALPGGAYVNPAAGGGAGVADLAAWALAALLVEGKMRALFSLLFGASMLLVMQRAGEDGPRVHLRRMATLAVIGAAHLYLLWPGDILLHYALVGSVAWLFREREAPNLIAVALLCFAVQLAIGGLMLWDLALLRSAAAGPDAPAAAVALWRDMQGELGVGSPAAVAAEMALQRGGWWALVRHRLAADATLPLELLLFNGPETLGLMLLGMAGLKSGFLVGGWSRVRYVRVATLAYGLGLPLGVLLLVVEARSGFDNLTVFGCWLVGGLPLRPAMAVGHAAVALLWLTGRDGGLRPWVAAAGRMALSNYLLTSLAMSAIFQGWGLGLFGRVDRTALYLMAPPAWLLMLLWSRPWLTRFRHGPLEWAWRLGWKSIAR